MAIRRLGTRDRRIGWFSEYVKARRILLDAPSSLSVHSDALVLVGAQAIYLHVGAGELALAPYTTDGDLVIQPGELRDSPRLDARRGGA